MVKNTASEEADDQADVDIELAWADPADSNSLRQMSAVCFLFARNIYDDLGIPIGSHFSPSNVLLCGIVSSNLI